MISATRYPLTDAIVNEAITWGDSIKMAGVLEKLKKKAGPGAEPVVIAVIGGSFTQGTGCDDEVRCCCLGGG